MICNLVSMFRTALASRKGVTALEYGVIAAATITVGMATFGAIGTDLATIFTSVAAKL